MNLEKANAATENTEIQGVLRDSHAHPLGAFDQHVKPLVFLCELCVLCGELLFIGLNQVMRQRLARQFRQR